MKAKSSPAASQGMAKCRGKWGKGGKAKADVQEEMDPRKLELLNWVYIMDHSILNNTISLCFYDKSRDSELYNSS